MGNPTQEILVVLDDLRANWGAIAAKCSAIITSIVDTINNTQATSVSGITLDSIADNLDQLAKIESQFLQFGTVTSSPVGPGDGTSYNPNSGAFGANIPFSQAFALP